MFAYLKGTLQERCGIFSVINVHDVGYAVLMPTSYTMSLDAVYALHIFTVVREDHITLYGFQTREEKQWFELLLNVQGVGGRLALAILSAMTCVQLYQAIQNKDQKVLATVSGLGVRIAERLVRELHDKAQKLFPHTDTQEAAPLSDQREEEVYAALMNLGYKKYEVQKELSSLLKNNNEMSSEQIIVDMLKRLGRHDRR